MEEGSDFVTFVEAYYEWLESNYQQLELRSNTNFAVGDTLTQGSTTGSVIYIDGVNAIVKVDNFDAFRCNVQCDEYLPVSSSSGGSTFIEKQFKLNPIHWGRKLFDIRDVDRTLDSFIVHFKEKYLKNIEFDTNTNKRLLIKNSYDLYRSKGTERSIDLFFRLVYGSSAKVYYPGDDLMRLSAAQWIKPQYLEITNSPRTIGLVGKQITGITSGATAFVEKYIKRKVRDGFVYVLYISNIAGTFVDGEMLKGDTFYDNLPTLKGSLSSATVTIGSSLFSVGDIVTFVSLKGDEAKARVSSISNATGVVDFIFNDGGWGYTVSGPSADYTEDELNDRTQSIVSTATLTLSNVVTSNTIAGFTINDGGTGYSNSDTITVQSDYINCTATVNTDASGVITDIHISQSGSGFFTDSPTVTITTSGGSSANIEASTKAFDRYFKYFEPFTQRLAEIVYDSASNNELFAAGDNLYISNGSSNIAYGTIIANANGAPGDANGTLTISVSNNGLFGTSNTLYTNSSVYANIVSISNTSVTSSVMGIPQSATLRISAISGVADFAIDSEIYQLDEQSVECANALIHDTRITGLSGSIDIENMKGVFRSGRSIKVRSSTSTASLNNVSLTVGLYSNSAAFINTYNVPVFSTNTATISNVAIVSAGSGAAFRVGTITDSEFVYMNTDILNANHTFTNTDVQAVTTIPLNNAEYGFEKKPAGNSSSVIFSCLNFDSFNIGTISSLIEVNPGTDYTVDPYVLAYQPYISAFDRHDYIFEVTDVVGAFIDGERIFQDDITLSRTTLELDDETGLAVGEKVEQGSANGIVYEIQASANTIIVRDVQGTFAANATALTSLSNGSFSATISNVSTNSAITTTAKGIVKSSNSTHVVVKRLQFNNQFGIGNNITGQSTSTTATIAAIAPDFSALQIGFNANIEADVVTANGTVTELEITDSGLGYRDNDELTFVSSDGLRTGAAIASVSGLGRGSGYYKNTKGFLSDASKIHDGNFYQEYSYEVLSRIPLDKYADMFKKVMHTAGTRFFGGVLLEETAYANVQYADSSIDIS